MQAKGLVQFFTISLVLVCIYQLLFTVAVQNAKGDAETFAQEVLDTADPQVEDRESRDSILKEETAYYLDSIRYEELLNLGVISYTYQECVENQLSLGLDLQGGMSVVLQVSVEDVILGMSNKNPDPAFRQALKDAATLQETGDADFVTYFGQAFLQNNPNASLASIFATAENKGRIEFNSTNEQVLEELSKESKDAIQRTFEILKVRIDQYGVTQPNITLQELTGRVIVELPGADNPESVRKLLQQTANLEFWETFENTEVINYFVEANRVLREMNALNDSTEVDSTEALNDMLGIGDEATEEFTEETTAANIADFTTS